MEQHRNKGMISLQVHQYEDQKVRTHVKLSSFEQYRRQSVKLNISI